MEHATNKDEEESGGAMLSRLKLPFSKGQRTRAEDAQSRLVQFRLLKSITDTQPTLVQRERRLSDTPLSHLVSNFSINLPRDADLWFKTRRNSLELRPLPT